MVQGDQRSESTMATSRCEKMIETGAMWKCEYEYE